MSDDTQIIEIVGQKVVVAYDPDTEIWYVHSSTVPGLTGEAASISELIEELQVIIRTLNLP